MSRETRMAIEHSTPMPQRFESGVTAPVKASEARHRDSESKNIDQRHFGHVQRQA